MTKVTRERLKDGRLPGVLGQRVLAVVAVLLLAPLLLAAYAVLTAIRVVAELLDDDHAQDWR